MHLTFGTGIRISALAIALAMTAACSSGNQQQAGAPSTTVAKMPDTAGTNNSSAAPPAAAAATSQAIPVSKTVWSNYQDYLTKVGRIGDGYFFVTEDGQGGGSWACGNALCEGSFDGQGAARQQCEASSPGKTCVLFAKDDRIQVNYEVAP